ncbi:MAG: hypothetical protein ACTSX8_04070 [Alphaproteobacteria bacterium]
MYGARERHDTIPPWEPDKIRRQQLLAWNRMAEQMVNVIKTVKLNEKKNESTVQRIRSLVYIVVAILSGGAGVNWYQGNVVTELTDAGQRDVEVMLAEASVKQDLILKAVVELAEAQALSIEAGVDLDPEKYHAAKTAALKARKSALEAKKATAVDPAEKADAERKIEQVDIASQKAAADGPGGNGVTPDGEPVKE